jgi:hypothetical protein
MTPLILSHIQFVLSLSKDGPHQQRLSLSKPKRSRAISGAQHLLGVEA